MVTGEDYLNTAITAYSLKIKSERVRKNVLKVIELLSDRYKKNWPGWVKSSEIFALLNENPFTVTNLLKNLINTGIVIRHECPRKKGQYGKPRVFYRIVGYIDPTRFKTHEELIEDLKFITNALTDTAMREGICRQMLFEITEKDQTEEIKRRAAEIKKHQEEQIEEIRKVEKIPDPCQKS